MFLPPPPICWQKFTLITVSVHDTLLLVGFSVLLNPSDYCIKLEFLNYLLMNNTDQVCSCSFLSKDLLIPNISGK